MTAASLAVGAWLMVCYDMLRILRIFVRHGSFLTGIEDLIYWLYSGTTAFLLLYRQNDGIIRIYVIGGIFAGMVIYDRCFSRIYLKLLKKAVKWLRIRLHKLKSGEKSEGNKTLTSAEKGQMGQPDGTDGDHRSGTEPGSGSSDKGKLLKKH